MRAESTSIRAMPAFMPPWSLPAIFLTFAGINLGFFICAWLSAYGIAHENGLIENVQVVILAASALIYASIISKQKNAAQTLAAFFCYMCAILILKELDFKAVHLFDPADKPAWVKNTLPELIRKYIKNLSPLIFLAIFIMRRKHIRAIISALLSWLAWPFYLCFALMVSGQAFEYLWFKNPETLSGFDHPKAPGQFAEEMIELNAYLLLLYAACSSTVISTLKQQAAGGRADNAQV